MFKLANRYKEQSTVAVKSVQCITTKILKNYFESHTFPPRTISVPKSGTAKTVPAVPLAPALGLVHDAVAVDSVKVQLQWEVGHGHAQL